MAWEARSGLKPSSEEVSAWQVSRLNGLGSPFGIETPLRPIRGRLRYFWLNGLGSPFGIETHPVCARSWHRVGGLNGLGSPFGIETHKLSSHSLYSGAG